MADLLPSEFLEDILFRDSNTVVDHLFEERSGQLFQSAANGSFVEICVQQRRRRNYPKHSLKKTVQHVRDDSELSDIEFSCQGISRFESPPAAESVKLLLDDNTSHNCPRYIGENDIYLYTISNACELDSVAASSQDCFRICFIRQRQPNSRLLMSRDLFETLMSTFDILPRFRDFILFFGFKHTEPGMGPPQLRWRTVTANGTDLASRRDVGFECAYELRYVEPNPYYVKKPWRLRQTAIYHRYKSDDGSSTWVVVSASSNTESSIDHYIKSAGDLTLLCPFDIHLLIVEAALLNWRPYLVHLTEEITELSTRALAASLNDKDSLRPQDIQERHHLKEIEDELIDIIVVLDSLHDTVDALLDNYTESVRRSSQLYTGDHDTSSRAFYGQMKEIAFSRKSVQSLQTKLQGTNALFASLLALRNSASLKQLTQEEHRENAILRRRNESGADDSSAVKFLIVVIMIYLPITAVCSFFSTGFVSLQPSGHGKEVVVAANVWLFVAIAAPLTVVTVSVWYAWVWLKMHQRRRGHPDVEFEKVSRWSG